MNRLYSDIHEPLELYSVTGYGEPDELAGVVVRDTLDKLFVHEVLHPDGEIDVDVSLPDEAQDAIILPEVFSISSYSITRHPRRYRVELVAEHVEHDYTYAFDGTVYQTAKPVVRVQCAAIRGSTSAPDQRRA